MKKLLFVLCTAALLFFVPRIASAEPVIYRAVALETKSVEVSYWYGRGKMPTDVDVVIKSAKAGKTYTVKATYWTGRKWAKVRTETHKAKKCGEPLSFGFPLNGIKGKSVVKLKINRKLFMVARN